MEIFRKWKELTFYCVIGKNGPMYICKTNPVITEAIGCSTQADNKALLLKKNTYTTERTWKSNVGPI